MAQNRKDITGHKIISNGKKTDGGGAEWKGSMGKNTCKKL